jgi:hypothetical protein
MVGACIGNSAPNGVGTSTITVTCPGAGQPQGVNGSIQLNNGGLFSGVTMSGDATLDSTGVLTLNTVPVAKGGTGAMAAAQARVNLGISTVGASGAYADLTGAPVLGTIATTNLPAGPLVGSNGTALISIPAISGDASLNLGTGVLTLNAPVGVPKGGTGAVIFGAHQVLLGNGVGSVTTSGGGTAGQVFTSNGQNADPTWQAPTGGGGGSGLTAIANNTLLGNVSGFSAIPVSLPQSAMLDTIGSARGTMVERGATAWQPIVPGAAGTCWTSNGLNADPTWQACSAGSSFGGTGGVVGVDASGTPFVFQLNNLTASTGRGSGILSAAAGGGGANTEQVNAQTGTTYTVASGDATQLTTFNNASAIAVTLPQPGATILAGWFADYSNINVGPVTFTPTSSTIDGAASVVLYPGQGIRLVSDGTNYFSQRGGIAPAQIGPLINVLTPSAAATDADTFPVVQGGSVATKQSMGAVWTWVAGHLPNFQAPQVVAGTSFTLDANTHNGKLVVATAAITVSLPATLAGVGVGFRTAIFNQSGGTVTLSNAGAAWGAWATSSGSLSIPNGQVAMVTVLQPVSAGVVYADISNTGAGGSGSSGFPVISGRFYYPRYGAAANILMVANKLYAMPKILTAGTYRGLAVSVGVAPTVSTACKEALYADNGSGLPGALLAENALAITTTGVQYSDFVGGDYTTAANINAWIAIICNGPNSMQLTSATGAVQVPPYMQDEMGGDPGGANQVGLSSTTIVTYPAGTLGSTNSGNFGAIAYVLSGAAMPITYIRAR